jgi:addiction module RelE/StbE family toxin
VAHIRWSEKAVRDLEIICEYISQDSEEYARLFAKRVLNAVESIPDFPYSGRIVPEYRKEFVREKLIMNYRIIYRVIDDSIEIVTIIHNARQLK